MYECVTPECHSVCVCVCSRCLLIFLFSLLIPGHTHTQLLSVSMRLTALKIAVQSMLDLFLHQSHTSSDASFSRNITASGVANTALQGRNPAAHALRKRRERENEVISQTSPPALLHFHTSQSHRHIGGETEAEFA